MAEVAAAVPEQTPALPPPVTPERAPAPAMSEQTSALPAPATPEHALAQPASSTEHTGEPTDRLMGLFRDIRAEAQNLQRSLGQIREKGQLAVKEARDGELQAALLRAGPLFGHNRRQIDERLRSLRGLMEVHWDIYDWVADEATHIENAWERAARAWPRAPEAGRPFDGDAVLRDLDAISTELDQVIFHTGLMTIPSRVNQYLKTLRAGRSLDFHAAFDDELPRREDREYLLDYMHRQPAAIQGVVDVGNGLIYHVASGWRRTLSYILGPAAVLLGAGLTFVFSYLGSWLSLTGWPLGPDRFGEVIVGYLFVVLGGFVHVGIDALKQARAARGQTFLALEDWLLWIHVKETTILVGVLSLFVGFIGLVLAVDRVEWPTAFLTGYGIDSFVDLFLQRFGGAVSSRTEALKGQLGRV